MPTPSSTPRAIADSYVDALVALDPLTSTALGALPHEDRLPDLSPDGQDALDDLARATLADLDAAEGTDDGDERRCARLLRERLSAALATSAAGEHLRAVGNIGSPVHQVRSAFTMMPTVTPEDWAALARRMAAVPNCLAGWTASLDQGAGRGLFAAPRQAVTLAEQLGQWAGGGTSGGWFASLAAPGPGSLRSDLDAGAAAATRALGEASDFLTAYAARAEGTPDAVGAQRYATAARSSTGADLNLDDAYAYGLAEVARLEGEMAAEAQRVLAGSTALEAMEHLTTRGPAVDGEEAVRQWLQEMMDTAIADLDGTHFTIEERLRTVQARIAPPGSAAAPYYTRPSLDFSRPGRTWLPTLGRTRFPTWNLVSTWYHEGVPGHHLQLGQWVATPGLSRYQGSVGSVSANLEGWALYAEGLMDELGYLSDPGHRLGYLDAQMMRAVRVVVDIGLHTGRPVPTGAGGDLDDLAGQPWTPAAARAYFGARSGRPAEFLDSEIVRYLGWPGQAIGYKLGERAWRAGRAQAERAHGDGFDLRTWHAAALAQGSLGLDDLVGELAAL